MSVIKLTHFAQEFRSMGGVESVLKHHLQADFGQGIESRFVVYQEDGAPPIERVSFLGLSQRSTIHQARLKLLEAVRQGPPEVAIHHTVWGMTYWADLDVARRRILLVHSDSPGLAESLRLREEWIDGVLCVSEALRLKVADWLPHLGTDRVGWIPYPVLPRWKASPKAPLNNRAMVLGFCGRLILEQKRVDRLPALCAQLDRAGLNYRLEVLGEGPERNWLETRLADRAKFVFHGRKSDDDYWRVLDSWDAIVFVSDYEGTPISLLESMSMGVIPIYPRIDTGGDAIVSNAGPELLYEPEDFARVAAQLAELSKMSPEQVAGMRSQCQQAISPYVGDHYISAFAGFVRKIVAAPRISREKARKPPWPIAYLPLSWVSRLGLLRRAVRRLAGR